ncbi:MAG: FkbM family methyltransferase [Bradyrhizobium sp.]
MRTVFDIGMYDGADTAYYLQSGYRVVAVEANPELVQRATEKFAAEMAAGQMICVNAAISTSHDPVELVLSGADAGSNSIFGDRVAHRLPIGSITVPGMTMQDLLSGYDAPFYVKVDIEGADRLCVLSLTSENRPQYLSFEVGDDVEELIEHARTIGFGKFKIINQTSFRELANQKSLYDRIVQRLVRELGYTDCRQIRRAGRFFVSGHSSGPGPWESDGYWYSADKTLARWREAKTAGTLSAWYDIHATLQ